MIAGARLATLSGLRRLVALSMAQDLGVYLIPGPEIAGVYGLDIEATGMHIVASPRHASVLLVVGKISPALCEAAAVVYAQMMRPRVLFGIGTTELSPLPEADILADVSQQGLMEGVRRLRIALAEGAFNPAVSDFDAPMLQTRIEYTCSMHPEIIRDEPGSCPKCGMNLIPREAQARTMHAHTEHPKMGGVDYSGTDHEATIEYTCPMHPEIVQGEPGSCPKCGMTLEPRDAQDGSAHEHHHMGHEATVEYTCPMHPEVIQNEPGSCPKCGMTLEPRETQNTHHDHAGMSHGDMGHNDMAFMSMVDVTMDLPRSSDGLPMDWIDVPFGPFFPGLPGGLLLTLTLDGDTVAGSRAGTMTGNEPLLLQSAMDINKFTERLAKLEPLAPVCYQVLACLAIENAGGLDIDTEIARARAIAVERERIVSHLGWLALFGRQTGFDWLLRRATSLQQDFLHADIKQIVALKAAILDLSGRLQHTPLLKSRTTGIGRLGADTDKILFGPVARASGINNDVRNNDKIYGGLGFTPAGGKDGDVRARLQLRVDEIGHSLALIEKAGITIDSAMSACHVFATNNIDEASGDGEAVIETPRGLARLQLGLENGRVKTVQLATPSTFHLGLIEKLTAQQELGDALVTVGSLDLSPWEIRL